jgi:hypothetical protein
LVLTERLGGAPPKRARGGLFGGDHPAGRDGGGRAKAAAKDLAPRDSRLKLLDEEEQ